MYPIGEVTLAIDTEGCDEDGYAPSIWFIVNGDGWEVATGSPHTGINQAIEDAQAKLATFTESMLEQFRNELVNQHWENGDI